MTQHDYQSRRDVVVALPNESHFVFLRVAVDKKALSTG